MDKPILLLTRPADAARDFLDRIAPELRGAVDVVRAPLLQVVPVPRAADAACDAAIFTSVHGIEHAPQGAGRPAWCVGAMTAEAAGERGWSCRHVALTADALVDHLLRQRPGGRVVHFSGLHHRGDIAERLTEAGLNCDRLVVYEQALLPLAPAAVQALRGAQPVIAPIFSPRTARHFAQQVTDPVALSIIAMSPAVADALGPGLARHVSTAAAPTREDMLAAVEKAIRQATFA